MAIINKWVENISHPWQTMLRSELRAWLQPFPGCIPYYCNEGIPQQLLQEAQDGRIEELKNTHKHHLHGQYQVMGQWEDKYGKQVQSTCDLLLHYLL